MTWNYKYKIYRVNDKDHTKGSVSVWEYNPSNKKENFWLTVGRQHKAKNTQGRATFDWDGAQKMRLDLQDLGEILAVLRQVKNTLGTADKGLYHQTGPDNNTILKMYWFNPSNSKERYLMMEFSTKKGNVLFRAKQTLTLGVVENLRVIIEGAVWQLFSHTHN